MPQEEPVTVCKASQPHPLSDGAEFYWADDWLASSLEAEESVIRTMNLLRQ